MKVRELLTGIEDELLTEQKEAVKTILKEKKKEIAACKKTLKQLEDKYEKLLDSDIEELELDDYEY